MGSVIESLQFVKEQHTLSGQSPAARGKRPPAGEPVIDRAFALLAAFTQTRRTLSLSELARATDQPTSTTLRLAQRLVAAGALERKQDGRYVVGLRMWEMGALAPRGMGLRQFALPYMTELAETTHENVLLVVLDGNRGLVIERLSGLHATEMEFGVTGSMPLHLTSSGLVLLANAEPVLQEKVLNAPMPMRPMTTLASPVEMRARIAQIRRDGFCVMKGGPMPVASVAAPIHGKGQEVVAALSVVMHPTRIDPASLVPPVRAAAWAVSRDLQTRG